MMQRKYLTHLALALLVLSALILGGCDTLPTVKDAGSIVTTEHDASGKPIKTTTQLTDYAAYLKSFEGGTASVKLVEMDCGAAECSFKGKITVYAPPSGSRPAPQPPIAPDTRSGWERGFDRFFTAVERIAPWGFGYGTLREAFKAASSPVNTTTNVSASGNGSSAAAGGSATGSFSAPVTTNTTTNTTNTTDSNNPTTNSHNGGNGAAGGNGGTGGTTGGAGAPGGAGGGGG